MPVRCCEALVPHQMHIPVATATLLWASPHPKLHTILNFTADSLVGMGLKILHLDMLLRQMHWLAEIQATAFHQRQGKLKHWPSSCLLTAQIPPASLAGRNFLNPALGMLPPGFHLLTSSAAQVGWKLLPPLLAQKSSHWFSPVVILQYFGDLTWQVNLHKEGREALCFSQAQERGTDTWASCQLLWTYAELWIN